MALWMILIVAPIQIEAGDQHGLNTLKYQPAKIAAIEGHWLDAPGKSVPLILFGWPDMKDAKTLDEVDIPHLGSLILTHSWNGTIPGLDDFRPEDRPDSTVIFWTFRLMVGLGLLMALLGVVGLWLRATGELCRARPFLYFAVAMGPAGLIAILAGWITTEMGRQPWVVYGLMRTADAVSNHSVLELSISLVLFVLLYFAVFGTGIGYMLKLVARGPDAEDHEGAGAFERAARPLSGVPDIETLPGGER
jgi:cytochrome bd ubiquinol oxidase subunit I